MTISSRVVRVAVPQLDVIWQSSSPGLDLISISQQIVIPGSISANTRPLAGHGNYRILSVGLFP